jgi:hypothetical protein
MSFSRVALHRWSATMMVATIRHTVWEISWTGVLGLSRLEGGMSTRVSSEAEWPELSAPGRY